MVHTVRVHCNGSVYCIPPLRNTCSTNTPRPGRRRPKADRGNQFSEKTSAFSFSFYHERAANAKPKDLKVDRHDPQRFHTIDDQPLPSSQSESLRTMDASSLDGGLFDRSQEEGAIREVRIVLAELGSDSKQIGSIFQEASSAGASTTALTVKNAQAAS